MTKKSKGRRAREDKRAEFISDEEMNRFTLNYLRKENPLMTDEQIAEKLRAFTPADWAKLRDAAFAARIAESVWMKKPSN